MYCMVYTVPAIHIAHKAGRKKILINSKFSSGLHSTSDHKEVK